MNKTLIAVLSVFGMALIPHGVFADDGAKVLENADREFMRAATERGLDGWVSFFTVDAVRLPKIGDKMIKGVAAVRKADASLFTDPNRKLVWEPADAHMFADGKSGVTTGHFKVILKNPTGSEKIVATGSYITGWRKEADGRWKVSFDTGTADPVVQPK
jgi:ketosteroid isomerase-like protein